MKKTVRKSVKIFGCTLLTTALVGFKAIQPVSALSESLPETSQATIREYTIKRVNVVRFGNTMSPSDDSKISPFQIVGYAHSYIGSYRAKKKVDGKYYDGVLIKVSMEPQEFYSTSGTKYYGFSQYLDMNASLPSGASFQGNSPTNSTIGASSYSVGLNMGYKSASVSGSVQMNKKYCDITDYSSVSKNKFDVEFDYKTNAADWSASSDRNKMLYNQTWQMGTCEWTMNKKGYDLDVSIYAKFGYSSNKNGSGMYVPLYDCSAGNSASFRISFK